MNQEDVEGVDFVGDVEVIHDESTGRDLGVLYPTHGGVWLVAVEKYVEAPERSSGKRVEEYDILARLTKEQAIALFKALKEWRMMVNRVDNFQTHQ